MARRPDLDRAFGVPEQQAQWNPAITGRRLRADDHTGR
jgi:hypothetical protein